MLTFLAEQIEEVRHRIDEFSTNKITNNYIIRQLHDGSVRLARELYLTTDDVTAFSSVTAQQGYPLPADFIDSSNIIWQFDVSHYSLQYLDRKNLLQSLPQQGDPVCYSIDEARKLLLVDPIPQGSAQTTTLTGTHSAVLTTITVASTAGFGGMGYITIDSEIIQYTAVTPTTFTGCVRGACNTVAASHTGAAVVTWDDFVLYYTRLPKHATKLITTSKVTIPNGSTSVTGDGTVQWVSGQNIYPGQYLGIGQMSTAANNENFPLVWYKIASIGSTTGLTLAVPFAETTISVAAACIITDMSEFYEQDCSIPVTWAEYKCEKILGNAEKQENARLSYNSEMALAKERLNGPDNLIITAKTRFASTLTGQIVRSPAHYEAFNI